MWHSLSLFCSYRKNKTCLRKVRNKKARQWSAKQMVVFLNMITCDGQGSQLYFDQLWYLAYIRPAAREEMVNPSKKFRAEALMQLAPHKVLCILNEPDELLREPCC